MPVTTQHFQMKRPMLKIVTYALYGMLVAVASENVEMDNQKNRIHSKDSEID